MALWRDKDPEVFIATVSVAAERIGVPPLAVEKDYWVCEALRAIVSAHPGEVVFKGGTSLEKMRIVQRFSEDLDLLVVGEYPSRNSAKNALKAMIATAAAATNGTCRPKASGGNPGTFHRSAYLDLPLGHSNSFEGLADPKAVLIELGQSGGPKPSLVRTVESLLCRALAETGLIGQWDDLTPFEATILHPGRTLIEKLLRVNNFVADPTRRDTGDGLPRIGRQFYDIWALLGEPTVVDLLTDKVLFGDILTSVFEVSKTLNPECPVPGGGFAASAAFDPSGAFAAELRQQHQRAMRGLYYGQAPPSFDDVLDRIQSSSELLNPES
ncbi:MAG: nucleotidyl transferase AbiEii/AbiGii toxin family protein [Mycobacteriaceae bacterium]|nr:nucleotidyl transferase AbiEii/AbiGii toxin family protein [Mycobacteriaceae bacterium]